MTDYIWVVVLFFLGVIMVINPQLLWKIEHIFTVKNGEPTELYIALMRIGGAFFAITALVVGFMGIM